eukprot:gene16702-22966_t
MRAVVKDPIQGSPDPRTGQGAARFKFFLRTEDYRSSFAIQSRKRLFVPLWDVASKKRNSFLKADRLIRWIFHSFAGFRLNFLPFYGDPQNTNARRNSRNQNFGGCTPTTGPKRKATLNPYVVDLSKLPCLTSIKANSSDSSLSDGGAD